MEDSGVVLAILKGLLSVVMAGGAVAIFRELVPMARGKAATRTEQPKSEEQ